MSYWDTEEEKSLIVRWGQWIQAKKSFMGEMLFKLALQYVISVGSVGESRRRNGRTSWAEKCLSCQEWEIIPYGHRIGLWSGGSRKYS
jgi:hypothetical protein